MNSPKTPEWIETELYATLGIEEPASIRTLRDEELVTHSAYDLLALAIELASKGELEKAELIHGFLRSSNAFSSPTFRSLYHATMLHHVMCYRQSSDQQKEDRHHRCFGKKKTDFDPEFVRKTFVRISNRHGWLKAKTVMQFSRPFRGQTPDAIRLQFRQLESNGIGFTRYEGKHLEWRAFDD